MKRPSLKLLKLDSFETSLWEKLWTAILLPTSKHSCHEFIQIECINMTEPDFFCRLMAAVLNLQRISIFLIGIKTNSSPSFRFIWFLSLRDRRIIVGREDKGAFNVQDSTKTWKNFLSSFINFHDFFLLLLRRPLAPRKIGKVSFPAWRKREKNSFHSAPEIHSHDLRNSLLDTLWTFGCLFNGKLNKLNCLGNL